MVFVSRGRFIAFEGGEGCGKSTQAGMLGERLDKIGIDHELTREPGGTAGAEAIRGLLLDPPDGGWGPRAEALLFAAARSDHVEKRIRPALLNGKWVVCDRYVDSSRAYQGGASKLGEEAIVNLHQFGSGGLLPDLCVLIQIDEKLASARLALRDGDSGDAIGDRSSKYHTAVADSFQKIADAAPDRFAIIDGDGSVEEIHARIIAVINRRLGCAL